MNAEVLDVVLGNTYGHIVAKLARTKKIKLLPWHIQKIAHAKAYYMKNKTWQLASWFIKKEHYDRIYSSMTFQGGTIRETFFKNPGPLLQWPCTDEADRWEMWVCMWTRHNDNEKDQWVRWVERNV